MGLFAGTVPGSRFRRSPKTWIRWELTELSHEGIDPWEASHALLVASELLVCLLGFGNQRGSPDSPVASPDCPVAGSVTRVGMVFDIDGSESSDRPSCRGRAA
ncbi:hypothetical protein E4U35_005798 [Claviceps purpurea]|nr:hypothetical protein E4U35_005798 [Claviceps purpurea]